MRIGSLCTGYGGLDMAVEAYFDAETIWTSEIDKYASEVITQRINKPNLGDLKKIDWNSVEPIDIITAGYPCQPFSHAGLRKGIEDERHIWPYIKEAISILRPRFVILENVRGHFGLGFREVLADLAAIRYDARWTLVRASDAGAPHRRERLFVIANPIGERFKDCLCSGKSNGFEQNNTVKHPDSDCERCSLGYDEGRTQRNQRKSQSFVGQLGEVVSNTYDGGRFGSLPRPSERYDPRRDMHLQDIPNALDQDGKLNSKFVEYMMGLPSGWVTECGLSRSQQLKILGNGVVPQQAYLALQLLMNHE